MIFAKTPQLPDIAMEVEPGQASLQPTKPGACFEALERLASETRHVPDTIDLTSLARDLQLAFIAAPRRRVILRCESDNTARQLQFALFQCNKLLYDSLDVTLAQQSPHWLLKMRGTTYLDWMPTTRWRNREWRDCSGHSMTQVAMEIATLVAQDQHKEHTFAFWNTDQNALRRLDMYLQTHWLPLWTRSRRELDIDVVTLKAEPVPWEPLFAEKLGARSENRPFYLFLVPALPKQPVKQGQ